MLVGQHSEGAAADQPGILYQQLVKNRRAVAGQQNTDDPTFDIKNRTAEKQQGLVVFSQTSTLETEGKPLSNAF